MPDYDAALRQLATDLIQGHAKDVEELGDSSLRGHLALDNVLGQLAGAEQDAGLETLKELLYTAVTTVAWPGQEQEPEPVDEWEPGRWYRIHRPDGTLWMETSNQREAQAEAKKTGWSLERLYVSTRTEWRLESTP